MIPPEAPPPDAPPPDAAPPDAPPPDAAPPDAPPPGPAAGRPGSSTFTIEGRQAPALFVVGWLATLLGLGAILVAVLSGGGAAAPVLLAGGLVVLSIGLIAGAGSQAIERRARARTVYVGPSPLLVFAASIPVSLLAVIVLGIPMALVGIAMFLLVAGKTRVPALGSLAGMASATLYAFLTGQPTSVWLIALLTTVLLVFTHRGNLARLITTS